MENFSVPGGKTHFGPLAKLGRFKSIADNFLVYIVTFSLASGVLPPGTLKFSMGNHFKAHLKYVLSRTVILLILAI